MKISNIKLQQKDENRVSVYVDGKYSFSMNFDQLLSEKLKKDQELDEKRIEDLKKLSDSGKQKQRTLEWLLMRPHSTKELRDYLYRKKIEKEQIELWTNEFTNKGYLNDLNFARWFTELRLRKNKSIRAIHSELRGKGVSPATIQSVLMDQGVGDKEALKVLINKLRKRPRYKDELKLKQYLVSKGFSYSDVKEALSSIELEDY